MALPTIDFLESPLFRLNIQFVTLLMVGLAFQMVLREYRRYRSTFLRYIALSLLFLVLQTFLLLVIFGWCEATRSAVPEAVLPMLDHTFKVGAIVLFVYAFVVTSPSRRSLRRLFLPLNFALMAISVPVIWYFWLEHLGSVPAAQQKFAYFWGDLVCEGWLTLLLLFGIEHARRSKVAMRQTFILAFVIFLGKELLHLGNILLAHNTVPLVVLVERLLLIPYFYLVILAIHREIIDEIDWVNATQESYRDKIYESTIQALVGALELKDPYTQGHAMRVTQYAREIGRRLGLGETELHTLYLGAILHDIGKIGIHEGILRKAGSLAEVESFELRQHPEAGAQAIEKIEALRHLKATICHHHERWDGTGYPAGLSGATIPLHARIVAVADAYDAMTSERPYRRRPLDPATAQAELERCRDSQFDPTIIDVFLQFLRETPAEVAVERTDFALASVSSDAC